MAGFQVITYGRFWVITEALIEELIRVAAEEHLPTSNHDEGAALEGALHHG